MRRQNDRIKRQPAQQSQPDRFCEAIFDCGQCRFDGLVKPGARRRPQNCADKIQWRNARLAINQDGSDGTSHRYKP